MLMNFVPRFPSVINEYHYWKTHIESLPLLQKNKELKKEAGGTCMIIGNGTSVNNINLVRFKNIPKIVVNFFCLHKQYRAIAPDYYVCLDPVLFTRRLLSDHFFPYIDKAQVNKTKFIFPVSTKKLTEQKRLLPNNKVYYVHGRYLHQSSPEKFDLANHCQYYDTSPPFVMLMAYWLGFRKIYLVGHDINFLEGESHFYPNFRAEEKDPYLLQYRDNQWRAQKIVAALKLYKTIGNFLRSKKVKVFNSTPGGYLDVFPRAKLESIKN